TMFLKSTIAIDVSVPSWFDSFLGGSLLGPFSPIPTVVPCNYFQPSSSDQIYQVFAADNFAHYARGDLTLLQDVSLSPNATDIVLYPVLPEHRHPVQSQNASIADGDLKSALVFNRQPVNSLADFGVMTYGAMLYQLARK